MEFANLADKAPGPAGLVRVATKDDIVSITRLLQEAKLSHVHVDWKIPIEWIGSAGFVVSQSGQRNSGKRRRRHAMGGWGSAAQLDGCLAVSADPPPAAWVRAAAVEAGEKPYFILAAMMAGVMQYLRENSVTELGWLAAEAWPESWLYGLGFEPVNKIETYWKDVLSYPQVVVPPELNIRPVTLSDMEKLAEIEAEAFDPLWRHSADGLALARKQSASFDVAVLANRTVGFQLSVSNQNVAHLVRLTVCPALHGQGIGSALLAHAIESYRALGLTQISLNTQVDNYASQRLYRKFGFYSRGQRLPVWALNP